MSDEGFVYLSYTEHDLETGEPAMEVRMGGCQLDASGQIEFSADTFVSVHEGQTYGDLSFAELKRIGSGQFTLAELAEAGRKARRADDETGQGEVSRPG